MVAYVRYPAGADIMPSDMHARRFNAFRPIHIVICPEERICGLSR